MSGSLFKFIELPLGHAEHVINVRVIIGRYFQNLGIERGGFIEFSAVVKNGSDVHFCAQQSWIFLQGFFKISNGFVGGAFAGVLPGSVVVFAGFFIGCLPGGKILRLCGERKLQKKQNQPEEIHSFHFVEKRYAIWIIAYSRFLLSMMMVTGPSL